MGIFDDIKKKVNEKSAEFDSENTNKRSETINNNSNMWKNLFQKKANEPEKVQEKCIDGDCQNGIGKYIWSNGKIYEGEWKNGVPNGVGKLYFSNGDIYEGQLIDNHLNGKGKYTKKDGNVYNGEFKDNKYWGYGTLTIANNNQTYTGSFIDGVFVEPILINQKKFEDLFKNNDADKLSIQKINQTANCFELYLNNNTEIKLPLYRGLPIYYTSLPKEGDELIVLRKFDNTLLPSIYNVTARCFLISDFSHQLFKNHTDFYRHIISPLSPEKIIIKNVDEYISISQQANKKYDKTILNLQRLQRLNKKSAIRQIGSLALNLKIMPAQFTQPFNYQSTFDKYLSGNIFSQSPIEGTIVSEPVRSKTTEIIHQRNLICHHYFAFRLFNPNIGFLSCLFLCNGRTDRDINLPPINTKIIITGSINYQFNHFFTDTVSINDELIFNHQHFN